ncbi:hypothetical protein Ocin01_09937 [Orchesella cincta]|uniref:Uncharacterized protein n=1 Tax=Orchesella cincta TaxID=48709 RepID=A0A1D2MUR1_ORCCI|nr:hypothetical protein Ocin01_09937 [Orchesella cincta]
MISLCFTADSGRVHSFQFYSPSEDGGRIKAVAALVVHVRMTHPSLFTDYPESIVGSDEKEQTTVKPGTVILTCKPFAYAIACKYSHNRCDTCLKE